MTTSRAILLFLCLCAAGCDILGLGDGDELEITLRDLPAADTLRQTGIAFAFESNGSGPWRAVAVVIDPGTSTEQSFSTDAAWLEEAPARFPVLVLGPISNGKHVFELRAEDSEGRKGSARFERVVHVPDVPYTLTFLGEGFDDSRATGINAAGVIAGTVYTGLVSTQTGRMVAWSNGTRAQPRIQEAITSSAAMGINSHGEIVGTATVSGAMRAVFWRGDSLEVMRVETDSAIFAPGIDNNHRALVFRPNIATGLRIYLLDVHTGAATQVSIPSTSIRMNGLGQIVAVTGALYGTSVATYGGLTIHYPEMRPGRHERYFRGVNWGILALNDRGEVLGTREGDPFLSEPDRVQYLDQYLPLAKQTGAVPGYLLGASGDVVSLRGEDSLYVWSREKGTRRLTFSNPGWTLDALSAMNASGQLVAHGVNNQTGQKGVLLLSPAAASIRRD